VHSGFLSLRPPSSLPNRTFVNDLLTWIVRTDRAPIADIPKTIRITRMSWSRRSRLRRVGRQIHVDDLIESIYSIKNIPYPDYDIIAGPIVWNETVMLHDHRRYRAIILVSAEQLQIRALQRGIRIPALFRNIVIPIVGTMVRYHIPMESKRPA